MMKYLCKIWVLLIAVALIGCDRPAPDVKTEHAPSLQSDLMAIDTLMQSQPDNALTLLLDKEMDDPYYQLLLSEALYKNDYAQTNRDELLEAMAYFDSVQDPFLSARCHYMIGVGYYEMDSVVPACEEYMKAIQIMEEHYTENELVGLKAKFMALTYTRLVDIFSDQYLHEQAIYFGNQALTYYHKFDAEPWQISWMLDEIGSHYDMMDVFDSADYYYHKALELLPDTNNLTYKMVAGHLAYFNYKKTTDKDPSLKQLYHLLGISESNNEFCSRCLSIGEIYYHETIYDSAWIYLTIVFNNSPSTDAKKQAAQWLAEICEYQGRYDEISKYSNFLIPFATQNEDNSTLKSQLAKTYDTFIQQRQDRLNRQTIRLRMVLIVLILAGLLFVIIILSVFYYRRKSFELFINEPVCQHILNIVNDTAFKAKMDYKLYTDIALNKKQLLALRLAADKHYQGFARKLRSRYPKLTDDDLNHCCLLLLGLEEAAISGLLQKSYTAVCDRNRKLKKELGIREDLFDEIRNI